MDYINPNMDYVNPNMDYVNPNMDYLAFDKLKRGLYKSCGIECLEGIMLEPCLLQACFHVAGRYIGATKLDPIPSNYI